MVAEIFAAPPFPSSFAAPLRYGVVEVLEVVGVSLLPRKDSRAIETIRQG